MDTMEYLAAPYVAKRQNVPLRGPSWCRYRPGQNISGYGKKISSDYMVRIGPRWHRVYITQISNVGSLWVIVGGKRVALKDFDLDDALRNADRLTIHNVTQIIHRIENKQELKP